jgi:probable rRNA maturation factor
VGKEHTLGVQIKGEWPLDVDPLRQAALATLMHEDTPSAEMTVVVSDDDTVQDLNNRFRGVDRPTDVLAFPNQPQEPFTDEDSQPTYLGDIVLSYPRAAEQASLAGHSVMAELQLLVVHGVLHLLGYDDKPGSERDRMWMVQETILSDLGVEVSLPD